MTLRLLVLLSALFLTAACGIQGDLYLPEEPAPKKTRSNQSQPRQMERPGEVEDSPDELTSPF